MAKGTLLYFVSDLHGSSLCFRKFVNATGVYKPTVLVLGGDVAGKAIQSIVKGPNGRWNCTFVGNRYELTEGSELAGLERLIADHGYYPYRAEPGELEAMKAEEPRAVFRLMRDRLAEWLDIADTRLRPQGVRLLPDARQRRPAGARRDAGPGAVGRLRPGQGGAAGRRARDDQLGRPTPGTPTANRTSSSWPPRYAAMADRLERPERAVFNLHPPPYATQLDDAPGTTTTSGSRRCWARSSTRRSAAPRCATSRPNASRWSGCTATSTSPPASAAWASAGA